MARRCCPAEPAPSLLASAGLKRTAQREALLAALEASDRPLTVEELRQRLEDASSGIPTLYRNLQRFVEAGWAEAIPGSDQVLRYVRCHSTAHHHHIQCQRCGRMTEVEGCGLEAALEELGRRSGFRILSHHLSLEGLCPECQG